MKNSFLKKLQHYLQALESVPEDDSIIKDLITYILSQQTFLDDSYITTDLMNSLDDWIEGELHDFDKVYFSLYQFWISLLKKEKIDIFYIGSMQRLKSVLPQIDNKFIHDIFFLDGDEKDSEVINKYFSKISESIAPFVIYDPKGLNLALSEKREKVVAIVSLYDWLMANYIPVDDRENSYAYILEKQYIALANPEIKTVVIGNSYGYYGFPDQELEKCVNISMHSLGIKQAQQLTEHILNLFPHIDNFLYCTGFFDLYCDLLKTKDPFNQLVISAFSYLSCHHGIKTIFDSKIDGMLVLNHLVMHTTVTSRTIPVLDDVQAREEIYLSEHVLISSTTSCGKQQQAVIAQQRAALHSQALSHKLTLEENQLRVKKMVYRLRQSGKKNVWLIPPFPDEYVKNISHEMRFTHRHFFAQFNQGLSCFIDLSENKNYKHYDFRDGDHLNFSGASKLVTKLRKMGVPV